MAPNRLSRWSYGPPLSRRELLRRGLWLGAGATALGLFAACGGQGGPAPEGGESTPGGGSATTPATSGGAEPTSAPVGSGEAGQVLVRTPGGAYEEAWRKAAWERFAEETGIQVVPVATNAAKIQAMVEAGNIELDVVDAGELPIILFEQQGALEQLDRSKFSKTNLDDIDPAHEFYLGNIVYSTVLGYNTESFPDKHPTSWAEFWDVETFPGSRMLEDMAAEMPNLELALLADGVPMDQLYPIDVDRAFEKLSEIRDSVVKWWDSGAVSAQMLADKQAVLGSVWNGRIQTLIDQGAPLAIEWNQSQRILQGIAILKGAPNLENAYKYVDFVLSPEVQANFAKEIPYGPANAKAFEFIDDETAARLPTAPDHVEMSFQTDMQWWVENQKTVAERWQEFLLGG